MKKATRALKIIDRRNTFKRRILRRGATAAEKSLWYWLRKNFPEYKWRRQHSLGYYIADFYCHDKNLVIELDGEYHDIEKQKEYDEIRTKLLNDFNIQVIRLKNDEILSALSTAIEQIELILCRNSKI